MKIDIYNQSGKKVETVDTPASIFEVPMNKELLHQALVRQHGNARQATAKTKTRGEVSGGGKKPFRQKGTGRARAGSTRSPIWKGGGTTFGPTGNQNYETAMNKKARRKALFVALSARTAEGKVIGLDSFTSEGKTKDAAAMIAALPGDRDVLVVITANDAALKQSCANLPNVKSIMTPYLNVHDLLKYDTVLFVKDALTAVEVVFGGSSQDAQEKVEV